MVLRHKTEYLSHRAYYAILVLPIFLHTCVKGFVSQQSEVLNGVRSLCGRTFYFGGRKNENSKKTSCHFDDTRAFARVRAVIHVV